jgi:hypothetical protein
MKRFRNRPLYYLRRLISTGIFFMLASCTTSVPVENSKSAEGVIVFTNKTPFTVHLVRGSGRIDVTALVPGESKEITNTFGTAEDYYPLFDVPLTNSWSLSRLRPNNIDFYYRIDNQKARQEIDINVPESFNETSAYIIFINNSRSGGVSISRNTETSRMTGINFSEAKSNVNAGETIVYRDDLRELRSFRLNPHNINFGEITYLSGYVYAFIYDGNEVLQIDARPLTEVGNSAPMSVEFTGDNLTGAEQMIIINAVTAALESYGVPLRIILPGAESSVEGRIFYTMRINLSIQVRPPSPPLDREMFRGDLSLNVIRSGKVLRVVNMANINEIFRSSLMNVLANRVKEEAAFFQEIKNDVSF